MVFITVLLFTGAQVWPVNTSASRSVRQRGRAQNKVCDLCDLQAKLKAVEYKHPSALGIITMRGSDEFMFHSRSIYWRVLAGGGISRTTTTTRHRDPLPCKSIPKLVN